MDYIKETLQKELRSVTRDIERTDEHIKHASEELESAEKRKAELTNAKHQLIISLNAGVLKPFNYSGNTCDICGGYLEAVSLLLNGEETRLKDERCHRCG